MVNTPYMRKAKKKKKIVAKNRKYVLDELTMLLP